MTNRAFNAFGLLEAMKKAMNPPSGFTAKEIGKNLFSFHFKSGRDMKAIIAREPWHFDKNILMLKELGGDEQPSSLKFENTAFWIRIYELPMVARKKITVLQIANKCGKPIEIDESSLEGLSRSVRVKVRVDLKKPLTKGMLLEIGDNKKIWVVFKYERLPSFCYLCGTLGHMRRECDLTEGSSELESLSDDKLPFGEWMKASPMKTASVSIAGQGKNSDNFSLRRQLFEQFKQNIVEEKEEVERGDSMEYEHGGEDSNKL